MSLVFNVYIIFHCIDISHFTYPFVGWWAFWLFPVLLLQIMLLLTLVYWLLWGHVLISLAYVPRIIFAELCSDSISNFLSKFQTVSSSTWKILYLHQQSTKDPLSSHSLQNLGLSFFILSTLVLYHWSFTLLFLND